MIVKKRTLWEAIVIVIMRGDLAMSDNETTDSESQDGVESSSTYPIKLR